MSELPRGAPKLKDAAILIVDDEEANVEAAEVVVRVQNLLTTRLLHRSLQQQNESLELKVRARTAELEAALAAAEAASLAKSFEQVDNRLSVVSELGVGSAFSVILGETQGSCFLRGGCCARRTKRIGGRLTRRHWTLGLVQALVLQSFCFRGQP